MNLHRNQLLLSNLQLDLRTPKRIASTVINVVLFGQEWANVERIQVNLMDL
jgi:hypothetical protein